MSTLNPNLKPPAEQELEEFLGRYIKGQPRAIAALAKAYAAFKSGIGKYSERDSKKPIGVFLFPGPSCTGKTQIGRILAQKLHGTPNAVTLIDCVSFQEKHEISKLIGAPPGYIGHGDKPILSEEKLCAQIPGYQTKASISALKSDKKEKLGNLKDKDLDADEVFSFWLCQLELIDHGLRNINRDFVKLKKLGSELSPAQSAEIKKNIKIQREILETQRNYTLASFTKLAQEFLQNLSGIQVPALPKNTNPGPKKTNIQESTAALKSIPTKTAVKEEPILVIIFDEIEKANESIWKFLLQLMREGRAVLGDGTEVDLSRAFIILTSNVASKLIGQATRGVAKIGFSSNASQINLEKFVQAELKKTFSQEFLNRLDAVVIFNILSPQDFQDILELEIEGFSFFLKKTSLELTVNQPVKDFILEEALKNPEEQVKSLQDCFKKYLVQPIGNLLATGQLTKRRELIAALDLEKKVVFLAK